MRQITFNNKKSYDDYKISIESVSIQPPSKKVIKVEVPFMNGTYDFSTVGTNGDHVYSERQIVIKFNLMQDNKTLLYQKYSEVLTWLMETNKGQLIFDFQKKFYFIVQIEAVPNFQEVLQKLGKLEVTFTGQPFKIAFENLGSEQLWDTFDFESDILTENIFNINGSKTVSVFNDGRAIVPVVTCSDAMTVTNKGYTANFMAGDNKDNKFKIYNSYNTIDIVGTGTIKFMYGRELL